MKVDDRSFRKALGCFASGVTVVTVAGDGDVPLGVTVSAFCSVSLDPPLVLFCLGKATYGLEAFRRGPLAIHVLHEGQRQASIQFASRMEDKWAGIDHTISGQGVPLIRDCLARMECSVHQVADGGDHDILICQVESLEYHTGGQPLLYFRGAYANINECI